MIKDYFCKKHPDVQIREYDDYPPQIVFGTNFAFDGALVKTVLNTLKS